MIMGLDSATPPTPAQARAAAAAGVQLWSGYLGRPRVGLYRPWAQAEFEAARLCGSTPIAYCSGWDDPAVCKATAAAWNVRLCLDVEAGIRTNGAWVQGWLDASGAGLYGNYGVHGGRRAAFHILAAYPGSGDVRATWWSATQRPAGPCGWQWAGTHPEFGVGVDRGDFDDWFGGLHGASGGSLESDMTDDESKMLKDLHDNYVTRNKPVPAGIPGGETLLDWFTRWDVILRNLAATPPAAGGGGLTAPQASQLTGLVSDIAAIRMRIEKDLA